MKIIANIWFLKYCPMSQGLLMVILYVFDDGVCNNQNQIPCHPTVLVLWIDTNFDGEMHSQRYQLKKDEDGPALILLRARIFLCRVTAIA